MKIFIMSQFSYCSRNWMFHDKNENNKINRTHKMALRIPDKDNVSSFDKSLLKDTLVTVHERNLMRSMDQFFLLSIKINNKHNSYSILQKGIFQHTRGLWLKAFLGSNN